MKNQESKYQENRNYLKELSKVAKMALKTMPDEYENVNDYIITECYSKNGNTEFNTFAQWKVKGYKIKKGEKAFIIWGKPQKAQKTESTESEQDEFRFFPLCYLFSNKQVEPAEERNNKVAEVQISYKAKIAAHERLKVCTSQESAEVLKSFFDPATIEHHESFKILMLNGANQVLGAATISEGGISGTVVDIRIIFQYALLTNATSLILSHNHPSGNIIESDADTSMTNKIVNAAKLLDIRVLDHVILSPTGEYYSFADNGLI